MTRRIPSYLAEAEPRPTRAHVMPPASIPSSTLFPPGLPTARRFTLSRPRARAPEHRPPLASSRAPVSSLGLPASLRVAITATRRDATRLVPPSSLVTNTSICSRFNLISVIPIFIGYDTENARDQRTNATGLSIGACRRVRRSRSPTTTFARVSLTRGTFHRS